MSEIQQNQIQPPFPLSSNIQEPRSIRVNTLDLKAKQVKPHFHTPALLFQREMAFFQSC